MAASRILSASRVDDTLGGNVAAASPPPRRRHRATILNTTAFTPAILRNFACH